METELRAKKKKLWLPVAAILLMINTIKGNFTDNLQNGHMEFEYHALPAAHDYDVMGDAVYPASYEASMGIAPPFPGEVTDGTFTVYVAVHTATGAGRGFLYEPDKGQRLWVLGVYAPEEE